MQFKDIFFYLICVNLYLMILVPVSSIHIRTPIITSIWSQDYEDLKLNPGFSNNKSSLFLINSFFNTNKHNVSFKRLNLSKKIKNKDYCGSSIKCLSHKKIKGFIISKININLNSTIESGIRYSSLQAKQRRKINPFDLQGGCSDLKSGFNSNVWPKPDYKNSMDLLIEKYHKAEKLYKKYKDWTVVFEKLGLKKPRLLSKKEKEQCARSIFNMYSPADYYLCKILYEFGMATVYNNVNEFFRTFKQRIESKLLGEEEVQFPRNDKFVFGIEPLDDVEPISEKCLRAYLEDEYERMEEVAKYNPEMARRMLTVIHRIYKPLELKSDILKEVSDNMILEDYYTVRDSKKKCMLEFRKTYPELKFPTIREDYLELYRHWYDPMSRSSLDLSKTIKQNFLETYRPRSRFLDKYVFDPIVGVLSGVALGKLSELLVEYLYENLGPQFEILHTNRKNFKYILGVMSYLLLSNKKYRPDYFYEVLKLLKKDIEKLEDGDVKSILEQISVFSLNLNRFNVVSMLNRLFRREGMESMEEHGSHKSEVPEKGKEHFEDLENVYNSELLKKIIDIRRQHMVDLGLECKVNDKEFRMELEDVATLLMFNSVLKMCHTCPDIRTYDSNIHTVDELYGVEVKEEEEEPDDPKFATPLLPYVEKEEWPKAKITLRTLYENNRRCDSSNKLMEYYKMINSLRYVCSICLPLSKTSVYRLLYKVAMYLGYMDHLPSSPEGEVVGYYISGEDYIDGKIETDDDYSYFYETKDEKAGIPPQNVERNKHNALLFTCMALHTFSNMKDFVSCTDPKDFGDVLETKVEPKELMQMDDDMPPLYGEGETSLLLEQIENWAAALNKNNGYIRRSKIETKYGYFLRNEALGDDPEKVKKRQIYELEKLRDEFGLIFVKKDRMYEIIKGMSMILGVSEEFLLKNVPNYWLNFVSNLIYEDLNGPKRDMSWYSKAFNMSEEVLEQVKHRVMMIHLQSLNGKYGITIKIDEKTDRDANDIVAIDEEKVALVDGRGKSNSAIDKDVKGVSDGAKWQNGTEAEFDRVYKYGAESRDEWLSEVFQSIKNVADKIEISQEKMYEHFRVYTFHHLIDDLRQLDLKRVTRDEMELIKSKYKSSDIVLVNAITYVIKEKVMALRKALNEAVIRRDNYLVSARVQDLVDMYKAVTRSLRGLIDEKYKKRLERALVLNNEKQPKHFQLNEIVGTDYYSPSKKLLWPDGTSRWEMREKYDATKRGSDKLKECDGDWELMDEEDGLSEIERRELGLKEEERKMLKPVKLYCRDTQSTRYEQKQRDRLVKEGKLPKELRCIPNVIHLGAEKRDPEYDNFLKKPEDEFKMYRPIMKTKEIYKAWIMYSYMNRGTKNQEEFIALFPATKKLIENPVRDWRYLYIRLAIRNDDIRCTRDWLRELYPNEYDRITEKEKEDCRRALEYCYEEQILRITGGAMEEVEDDLGNTEDYFFHPFEISTVCRMDYIYSHKIPDDKQMEYMENLQKFLHIGGKAVEEIHSKCFHYAVEREVTKVIYENNKEKLEVLEEKYIKPLAKRLKISKLSYENILDTCVFGHVSVQFRKAFEKRELDPEIIEKVDRFIELCFRLKVISDRPPREEITVPENYTKFVLEMPFKNDERRVIENYILASIYENNKIDVKKLTCLCNLVGYKTSQREEILREIGRKFYYKYMMDHHEDNIYMETFDELKHLHSAFGLEEKDFKKMIYDYRLFKLLKMYMHNAGLETFNKALPVILNDKITKYIPLNKVMKEDWLVFILQDLIRNKTFDISDYLALSGSEYLSNVDDPLNLKENEDNIARNEALSTVDQRVKERTNPLAEMLRNIQIKFDMPNNELLEGLYFHVHEDGELYFVEIVKALFYTKETLKTVHQKGMLAKRVPRVKESPLKPQGGVYEMIVDFLKILSMNPKITTTQIWNDYAMDDTGLIRKFIKENARSDKEESQMLKLVDLYLEKRVLRA